MQLHRYWFRFETTSLVLQRGCGVTAYSREDALQVLCEQVFQGQALPVIREIIEDIDVSTLDDEHILPNIGVTIWRGVWYPRITYN